MKPMQDTLVVEMERHTRNEVRYEQQTQYMLGRMINQRVFEIGPETFKLLEDHGNIQGAKQELEILSQRNVEVGGQQGYEMVTNIPVSTFKKTRKTTREFFSMDTVFHWNGEDIPSVKFRYESEMVTYNRILPVIKETNQGSGVLVYSKGMGMTYFRIAYDNLRTFEAMLVSVDTVTLDQTHQ